MANINTSHIVLGDDTLVLQDADLRSKKVNAFQNSPDDNHYPSEKLVKDSLDAKLNNSQKGANNGVAELGPDGKVPSSQLPTIPDVSTKYDTGDTTETTLATGDYIPFYDVSASARRKTTWSNIKAKLKSYFDGIYLTSHQNISGKADKVHEATSGNFASLDSNGNLADSGHKHSDYLTSHQDISGKADKVSGATNGDLAKLDSNGNVADSGVATSDVSDAVTKKHSHSNKSILDLIPTILGTYGQVLSIGNNSNIEWRTPTSGSQGSSTLSGLTDTDIQSPSHGQFLRYDADEGKWVNDTFGGMFIANITTTEEGGVTTYSCDKTFDEIAAAIESGLRVRMFDVASGAICENVCLITIGGFGFQGVGIDTSDITNDVNVFIFCMQNNGVDVFGVSYVPNLLPPMSGNSGKVLTNNGTKASWTDFPEELPSLSNQEGRYLRVKPTGGGVEWASVSVPGVFTCRFYYENTTLKCSESVSTIISKGEKNIVIGYLKTNNTVNNIFLLRSTESSDGFAFFDTIYYSGSIMAKCLVGTTGNTDSWEFDDFPVPTNYDFTHTANQAVSGSVTVTYAANTRGSRMVSASADLSVSFAVNNGSDNYLWVKNTGSVDIEILINSVTWNGNTVSNVYIPDTDIVVKAGHVCEIGIVCNADGAFITSRSDLSL